ncbi:type II secretion system protein [Candidatus Peregrinibacteria bacterium]|nr:MAG: type II secretion system protein [Candidatus Peregrinibacteria bacterium]
MKHFAKYNSGFTLLEILLVVALFTALAGVSLPVSLAFLQKSSLDVTAQNTVQTLRRARTLAQSSAHDMSWGVYAEGGQIILFGGDSYATRNTSFDETLPIPELISVSGQQETVFEKFSGKPKNAGTLSFQALNDTLPITIGANGLLFY